MNCLFAIGIGLSIQNMDGVKQENPIAVVEMECPIDDKHSINGLHSSSLNDGLKSAEEDVNIIYYRYQF